MRLDTKGYTDAALDLLYDSVDEMLRSGKYSEIDSLLRDTIVDECSTDILLGLLTATLPARSKLPYRREFFDDSDRVLKHRPEYEKDLLTGLD